MEVNLSIFNSNKVMKFTGKLLTFLLIIAAVDLSLGRVIGVFYSKTLYGENWPKINWMLHEDCDIVLLGSSRTFRHYIPSYITKETGLSAFNAGENGQFFLYAYALEQLVLEQNHPKVIVLDVLPSYIAKIDDRSQEYERLETVIPHAGNKAVRDLLIGINPLNRLKLISHLYRYNSRILNIADNFRTKQTDWDRGYVSIGRPRFRETNLFMVDLMERAEIDSNRVRLLKDFIEKAKAKNVQVILTFSPIVEPMSDNVTFLVKGVAKVAHEMKVPFMQFGPDRYPEYMDRRYFMDYIHMNADGAKMFSEQFAHALADTLGKMGLFAQDTTKQKKSYAEKL